MAAIKESIKSTFRKIYRPVGFSKGYNFILFFIFGGALMGFTLARFQFLNITGIFCGGGSGSALPGECYYYLGENRYYVGIILHLGCILPAAFLAVFQFVPVIRHKVLLYHRIAGYLIILLVLLANVGALMIGRMSFGGGLEVQTAVGVLAMMSTVGIGLAYYNIKKLQIDQHRAWMLRSWVYMGSIITSRLIMTLFAVVISSTGGYQMIWPCAKLDYALGETKVLSKYPACSTFYDGSNLKQTVIIESDFGGNKENVAAAVALPFGAALWLSIFLHALGVELYLRLTPVESARLRQVSLQRQTEAGYRNPGKAGLTSDRLGDCNE
ncbi:hypothetical protein FQN57_000005 [Myotisia sp. PD_48]|nr:hypothetical protein FQN57_000005 [Myotisia sp. PD_48]